jgi:SAM-dependent methyltransferase
MASRTAPQRRKPDWSERGSAAIDSGDLEAAKQCFTEAVRADSRNARHRFHLAVVLEGLWELGAAGARLTEALRLDPRMADAARRLSRLASTCTLPEDVPLDPVGLRAGLAHDSVDRELIAAVAMRHLAGTAPLSEALQRGRSEAWLATARSLCLSKTGQALRDELLLDVLRSSVFRNPDIERLLMALRRVLLLEAAPERFEDRALVAFAIALMQQCWINEYLWSVSEEEARAIDALALSTSELLAGDVAAGRKFLLAWLYKPFSETLGTEIGPQHAGSIRPRALREAAVQRLAEAADERERAARLPRLGAATDATSRKVAAQYEASPYPRWTSVGVLRPEKMQRGLRTYFKAGELAFLERPFEVLIAGCGTGQQAVQAALAYGSNARVLALDLSAASLAYAARMTDRFGAGNVEFAQADLRALDSLDPKFLSRFDVIECIGVLHHMADPFEGWRTLIKCLAKDGRMLLGLYSAAARRNLAALRGDPAYPGPGCSEDALRNFRQLLLDRADGELGSELKISPDFYTASNFRDLTLHVSEHCLTLPEIARFLRDNGLSFRGFQLDKQVFSLLQERFPKEAWPGTLEHWSEFEQANPLTFTGMYVFWCGRT